MYQKLETERISQTQARISTILNEKKDTTQLSNELNMAVQELGMELIVLDNMGEVVFTTFPNIDITDFRDVFNHDHILYKSQSIEHTVNGEFQVMMAVYHVPVDVYLDSKFIWLTIYIAILFFLLIIIITLINNMLLKPLKSIRMAINEMHDFDLRVIDERTALGAEFKEFIATIDYQLQDASKQYTELELLLLFERQQLELLFRIARGSLHELKTPVYQTLLSNEKYLQTATNSELAIADYNIAENKDLLNRINKLLASLSRNFNNADENIEYFDGIDLFYEIEDDLAVIINQKNLTINFSCTEKMMLCQNAFGVRLVLHNILLNAVKYTSEDSEIDVEFNVEQDEIEIICQNIATAEDIERLQSNRFSATTEKSHEHFSSGNGIYIIKEITKMLKGKADVTFDAETVKVLVSFPQRERK